MLTLAGLRYRNVLAGHGGPIASIEVSEWPGLGERRFQANAHLREGLVNRRRELSLYGSADGSGTDASPLIARYMAISECLERWAYHALVNSPARAQFGFDLDNSSNGMAAFPGLTPREARHRARFEAIERASLFDWWEGRCAARFEATPWRDIRALRIDNPLETGVTAITFQEYATGGYAYGHAAGPDFRSACRRALIEMQRCRMVLQHHRITVAAGQAQPPTDRFERRCLFFSGPEGHDLFQQRIRRGADAPAVPWRIVCDRELPGPWTQYAAVWRVVIPPVTAAFLAAGDDYFFW